MFRFRVVQHKFVKPKCDKLDAGKNAGGLHDTLRAVNVYDEPKKRWSLHRDWRAHARKKRSRACLCREGVDK